MRPKISVYIATSIDGFIARNDGTLDWLDCVGSEGEDYGFKEFLGSVDAVILGRKTYEVAATAYGTEKWPYQGKRMIVLSTTLQTVIPKAEIYSGDLAALATQLHREGVRHAWIDGGVSISQCLRVNMVDEIILSIIPTLLGSGIPLFDIKREFPCRLLSTQTYPSGLVQIKYCVVSEDRTLCQ